MYTVRCLTLFSIGREVSGNFTENPSTVNDKFCFDEENISFVRVNILLFSINTFQ